MTIKICVSLQTMICIDAAAFPVVMKLRLKAKTEAYSLKRTRSIENKYKYMAKLLRRRMCITAVIALMALGCAGTLYLTSGSHALHLDPNHRTRAVLVDKRLREALCILKHPCVDALVWHVCHIGDTVSMDMVFETGFRYSDAIH
jgi:hypothetical protein